MKTLYNTSAPSVIWRIDVLTDEEKIVLFNACHYLKNKDEGSLDIWLLSYMSGKDKSEVHRIFQNLVKKGFIVTKPDNNYINEEKIKSYATDRDFVKRGILVENFIGFTQDK